ncbi:type VII secretion target [Lentzea sp. BCCO 10_0798]|uniref:Type VII secretion target n=1 Tax=Lentzea kristufekii TaxID=3095430 RepID=A0ABU4TV24_9PSEU|nr:type VII secretion target [Lentzea sp. BCCO 10_0798]MDX8052146.1 type VII secretion target [Lentzea sp. BCCO 10_0798]
MAGRISVDAEWLEKYADRIDGTTDDLRRVRDAMKVSPLRPQSFGEIGRTVGTAQGYARAAELLNSQLARACDALEAASKGLHAVAKQYGQGDEESLRAIKKADRRYGEL